MTDSTPAVHRAVGVPGWRRPLAGVAAVAVMGAALGAYFGLRANFGGAAGTAVGPPPRTQAALAFDEASGALLMFGGLGRANAILGDTWSWDGHTWIHQHPSTSPPARFGALMAYDPQSRSTLLFGGVTATTWSSGASGCAGIAGGTATGTRSGATPPQPVCSTPRGGIAQPSPTVDGTWLWSGNDWHRVAGAQPPSMGAQMATDPAGGHVVLVTSPGPLPMAGAPAISCPAKVGPIANDDIACRGLWPVARAQTWTWRGGGWHLSATGPLGSAGQPASGPGRLVADSRSGHLAYFTRRGTPPCVAPAGVPPATSSPASAPSVLPTCPVVRNNVVPIADVWTETTWTGSSWTTPTALAPGPPELLAGSIAPDPSHHAIVFLSSLGGATVTFDGTWRKAGPRSHPAGLQGAAMAYDAATGQVVVFGGDRGDYVGALSNETWTWDGSNWTRVSGAVTSAPPRLPSAVPGTAVPLPAQASPPAG